MVDYIFMRDDPKVRGTATLHLILNLIALSVFSLDAYLRSRVPEHRTNGAFWLSAIGAVRRRGGERDGGRDGGTKGKREGGGLGGREGGRGRLSIVPHFSHTIMPI
jgi:hypothetical protein